MTMWESTQVELEYIRIWEIITITINPDEEKTFQKVDKYVKQTNTKQGTTPKRADKNLDLVDKFISNRSGEIILHNKILGSQERNDNSYNEGEKTLDHIMQVTY